MPISLAFLIFGVVIGLLLLLSRPLLSKKPIIKYSSAVVLAGLLFWLFLPKQNPLKKYGIDYRFDNGMASPSKESVTFFINSTNGEIAGPRIIGENLIINFQDLEKTGIKDIVITMGGDSLSKAVIRPLVKDGHGVGFHVLENQYTCLAYPEEGYYCP